MMYVDNTKNEDVWILQVGEGGMMDRCDLEKRKCVKMERKRKKRNLLVI